MRSRESALMPSRLASDRAISSCGKAKQPPDAFQQINVQLPLVHLTSLLYIEIMLRPTLINTLRPALRTPSLVFARMAGGDTGAPRSGGSAQAYVILPLSIFYLHSFTSN